MKVLVVNTKRYLKIELGFYISNVYNLSNYLILNSFKVAKIS